MANLRLSDNYNWIMLRKFALPITAFLAVIGGNSVVADIESDNLRVFKRSLKQERAKSLTASTDVEVEAVKNGKKALEDFEKKYGKIFRTTMYASLHPDIAKVCGSVAAAVAVKNRLNCYQLHFVNQGRFEGRIVGTEAVYNLSGPKRVPVQVYFDPLIYNITSARRTAKIETLYEIANRVYKRPPIPGQNSFDSLAAFTAGNPLRAEIWEIFSLEEYALANPDIETPSYVHFSRVGLNQGRIASRNFNVETYRRTDSRLKNLSNFEVAVDYINGVFKFPAGVTRSRVPTFTDKWSLVGEDYTLSSIAHRPFRFTNPAFDPPKAPGNERISDLVFNSDSIQVPVRITTNAQGRPILLNAFGRPRSVASPAVQRGRFSFDVALGRFLDLFVNFPIQTARFDLLGEDNLNSDITTQELLWWDSVNARMSIWRTGPLQNNALFRFQVLGTAPIVGSNGTPYTFVEGLNQQVVPVGLQDMSGDGQADVIVQSVVTRVLKVVVLRDGVVVREYPLNYTVPANHKISGSGVFTANNRPALVEISQSSGSGITINFLDFEGSNLLSRFPLDTRGKVIGLE